MNGDRGFRRCWPFVLMLQLSALPALAIAVLVLGGGTALLAWIAIGFIRTGARIVS